MADRPQQPGTVQDYTAAFLWSFGLLLFMALLTIASLLGGGWMIATAAVIDRIILWRGRLPRRH